MLVVIFVVLCLEPTPRIELGTSFLPRMRSTTELCGPEVSPFNGSVPETTQTVILVQGVGFEPTKPSSGRFTVCWV